jgi:glycosyltransferase involved in cell wall biosynthesis
MIRNAWQPTSTPWSRLEARARLRLPPDGLRIGWVGRLSAEKAPDVMVRAFAQLGISDVRLSLVGDGGTREDLVTLAESLGVRSRVDIHGDVADAAAHLRAFDVIAITSHTEGTPMILFEAMAAAVPVVTTSVGGIPDVVSEHQAWMVPAADAQAIAAKLREVLLPARDLAVRVHAATERLADFDTGPWTERYRAIYAAAIRQRRRA